MQFGGRMYWLLLPLVAAGGCNQDFSLFRFERETDRARATDRADGGSTDGAVRGGADASLREDAAPSDASPHPLADAGAPVEDTGPPPRDAAPPLPDAGAPRMDASTAPDGSNPGDARVPPVVEDAAVDPADADLPPADAAIDTGVEETTDAATEDHPDASAAEAMMDASAAPSGAMPFAGADSRSAQSQSARETAPVDAAAPTAAGDAGEDQIRAELCVAAWDQHAAGTAGCRDCACDACAAPILDCLLRGTAEEQALCRDVLLCSLRNHCQDYTCYCSTSSCDRRAAAGDGPCAAVVNAAGGGSRTRVSRLRNADPPDLDEPLIRAGAAIACIYGVHASSPGASAEGMCSGACQ